MFGDNSKMTIRFKFKSNAYKHCQVEEKVYVQWVQCMVKGFVGGRPKVGSLLDHLLKVYDKAGKEIEESPKSTRNKSIRNGVVHCLTYGYTREELDITTEEVECDVCRRGYGRQRQRSYTVKILNIGTCMSEQTV